MHRHGYKGTKFGRERHARRALLKSLADSLILNESIETTLPKAKQLISYTEKLITKAKLGSLHSRRQVIRSLATKEAAHKLVDEISPKLGSRTSGYLRITKEGWRRGDSARLARISFVDNLTQTKTVKTSIKTKAQESKSKKIPAKSTNKPTTQTQAETQKTIEPHMQQIKEAPKRAGRRGNR